MPKSALIWLSSFLLTLGIIAALAVAGQASFSASRPQPISANPPDDFSLVPFATGLPNPVDIAHAGDDRLFVVDRLGLIYVVLPDGSVLPDPFLDITARVNSDGFEQGLLGLAFHPAYADNGYFYVNYTNFNGDTQISRFNVTADPDIADPDSEFSILPFDQPYGNHNGGDLNFGPDGYLYIATGDGGDVGDPHDNGQRLDTLLGKLLRIDVDSGSPYAIPPDNPFVDGDPDTLDEIWAYGLRNPWRFSFDRLTGDLFIGDVGQGSWEEIDFQPASSPGGENYGWRCYEGNHPYNLSGCGQPDVYDYPIHEYDHGQGYSVTGGYVYRGTQQPGLYGLYIFTDWGSDRFWSLSPDGQGGWDLDFLGQVVINPSSFGESSDGELFVAGMLTETIYRITGSGDSTPTPTSTDQPGPTPTGTSTPTPTATSTDPAPLPTHTSTPTATSTSVIPGPTHTPTPTATSTQPPADPSPTPTATPPGKTFRQVYLPSIWK